MGGIEDITYDFGLMDYLFLGQLPATPQEVERILKLAQEYRAFGEHLQKRLPQ